MLIVRLLFVSKQRKLKKKWIIMKTAVVLFSRLVINFFFLFLAGWQYDVLSIAHGTGNSTAAKSEQSDRFSYPHRNKGECWSYFFCLLPAIIRKLRALSCFIIHNCERLPLWGRRSYYGKFVFNSFHNIN